MQLLDWRTATQSRPSSEEQRLISYGLDFIVPSTTWENQNSGAVCESRGGRPGLSVLTSLLVSVDVKLY